MKKNIYSIMALMLFAFLFYASASSNKTTATPVIKKTFTFDYAPTKNEKPGSAEMVLALVNPNYASTFTSSKTELFQRFKDGMGKDIEEVIIAEGFNLKGPYKTFDEIIYGDKKSIDMVIEMEIKPTFTASQAKYIPQSSLLGTKGPCYLSEMVSLVGKINLTGIEPLTKEKIWVKSLDIPPITDINIRTSQAYEPEVLAALKKQDDNYLIKNDAGVYNAIGEALTSDYKEIMSKIDTYLNPDELKALKDQIKELKKRKEF